MEKKQVQILLVEDNPGDVYLFRAALAECSVGADVSVFDDGLSVWRHLEKVAVGEAARPDLVVLDLNLPGMGGRQVLEEMTKRPELHALPVCVFTGASSEQDVIKEHPLLRLCFFAKVDNFQKLCRIVHEFVDFAARANEA